MNYCYHYNVINPEVIMLNTGFQHQKPHIIGFHLYEICRKGKFIQTKQFDSCQRMDVGKNGE